MSTTFDGLREILVKDYELDAERLTASTLLTDIELDSLALTELIFSLEDKYSVVAKTNGAGLATLGDVASYIDRLIAERDAAAAAPAASEKRTLSGR
ncbi:MAG TPA: phosphopantetheine-binding protein [Gammaproteobacteria bacterium]|jgi:acyl carrier protein|nr:phosphopantetheine-binding protein [Gammaproteobacteria bacterium]